MLNKRHTAQHQSKCFTSVTTDEGTIIYYCGKGVAEIVFPNGLHPYLRRAKLVEGITKVLFDVFLSEDIGAGRLIWGWGDVLLEEEQGVDNSDDGAWLGQEEWDASIIDMQWLDEDALEQY